MRYSRAGRGSAMRLVVVVVASALVAASCGSREQFASPSEVNAGGVGSIGDGFDAASPDSPLPSEGEATPSAGRTTGGEDASQGRQGDPQQGGSQAGGGDGAGGREAPAGVGEQPGSATGKTDPGVSDTSIILGNTTSQSGAMAGQFDGTPNAAFSYLQAINQQGGWRGRKLEMKILDDGLDGTRNASQTRRLVEETKVFAMLGNATPVQDASVGYLREKGIPVVVSLPATAGCIEPNVVPCSLSPNKWSGAAEKYLGPQGEGTVGSKAALIWIAQQISRDQARGVRAALKTYGWDVVTEFEAQLAQPEFTSFVLQARNAGAEMVYSVMEISSNSRLGKDMARQNWDVPLYGLVNYDEKLIDNLGAAAEGHLGPAGPVLYSEDHPAMNEYRQTYRRSFPDAQLGSFSTAGWLAAKLFVDQGLARLGNDITRQALLDSLYQVRDYTIDGFQAPMSIYPKSDPRGTNPSVCTGIVKVENGKFRHVVRKTCADQPVDF